MPIPFILIGENCLTTIFNKAKMGIFALLLFSIAMGTALGEVADPNAPVKHGAHVIKLIKHDVSLPLKEIPAILPPAGPKRVVPNKPIPPRTSDSRKPVTGGFDPGLQLSPGPGINIPSVTKNWEGVGQGFV